VSDVTHIYMELDTEHFTQPRLLRVSARNYHLGRCFLAEYITFRLAFSNQSVNINSNYQD